MLYFSCLYSNFVFFRICDSYRIVNVFFIIWFFSFMFSTEEKIEIGSHRFNVTVNDCILMTLWKLPSEDFYWQKKKPCDTIMIHSKKKLPCDTVMVHSAKLYHIKKMPMFHVASVTKAAEGNCLLVFILDSFHFQSSNILYSSLKWSNFNILNELVSEPFWWLPTVIN